MASNLRNVVIVLVLDALVAVVPGGGTAAGVAGTAVKLVFYGALGWVASLMYREHRTRIYSLGDRHRAVLYGSLAVAAVTLTATSRLWSTSGGSVAWLVLMAGAAYGLFSVIWAAREY